MKIWKDRLCLVLALLMLVLCISACDPVGPGDSTDPSDPTKAPTVSTGDPTEPSGDPTEPSGDPTEPSDNPTEPSDNPTEPSDAPTEPPHTHSYTSAVTAPTCTEDGYTTYTCDCGDTYQGEIVAAKGHSYTETVTAPTCTDKGYTTYTCACGDGYTGKETAAQGHSWGQWTTTKEPTETAEGTAQRSCGICGEKETKKLAVLGHTHKYTSVVTAPTCMGNGYTTNTCACGDVYQDNIVPAKGHSYTSKVTTPATCTSEGVKTYSCTCGYSYTEKIVKTEHSYNSKVTAPTCTEKGYTTYTCGSCGNSYQDNYVAAKGHSHKETVTAPTCTEKGYTTYTCVCGDSYTGKETAALDHDWGAWTTTKEPTYEAEGEAQRKCSRCTAMESKKLDKLDPPPAGSIENPVSLVIGNNTAKPTGSDGYYFTWTATADGTLILQFPIDEDGSWPYVWSYVIENLTAGSEMTKEGTSDGENASLYNPVQVSVFKGDEIRICVKSTASTVDILADLADPLGTQDNPYHVNPDTAIAIRIPAGEKVYLSSRAYGLTMVVTNASKTKVTFNGKDYSPSSGKITVELPYPEKSSGLRDPLTFVITNNASSTKVVTVNFAVPAGHSENPAELVLGSNTASIKKNDSDGYVFTWTATQDGTLTITMPSGNWSYSVHNMTTYQYGNLCYSDDNPVQKSTSITVKQGDVIQVSVCTYQPGSQTIPEGKIKFTATLE